VFDYVTTLMYNSLAYVSNLIISLLTNKGIFYTKGGWKVLEDNNDLTSKSTNDLLCTGSASMEVFRALFRLIRVHGQLVLE